MNTWRLRWFGGLAAVLTASATQAVPVRWTLQDVTFFDGGTASGSFVFDVDKNLVTEIDVTTTEGSNFAGDVYRQPTDSREDLVVLETNNFPGQTDETVFVIFAPFDQQGGIIETIQHVEALCLREPCGLFGNSVGLRVNEVPGTLIGVVIPIPAAAWLFGSALGLLGWMKRRSS